MGAEGIEAAAGTAAGVVGEAVADTFADEDATPVVAVPFKPPSSVTPLDSPDVGLIEGA